MGTTKRVLMKRRAALLQNSSKNTNKWLAVKRNGKKVLRLQ